MAKKTTINVNPISITQMRCCGVKEAHGIVRNSNRSGIDNIFSILHAFYRTLGRIPVAHVMFTYAGHSQAQNNYGTKLANAIKREGLGDVVCTDMARNPNSGRNIRAYFWTIDKKAASEWIKNIVDSGYTFVRTDWGREDITKDIITRYGKVQRKPWNRNAQRRAQRAGLAA